MPRSITVGIALVTTLVAGCGGGNSPAAPSASGFNIVALQAQIQNLDAGYGYTLQFTVHNGNAAPAAIVGVDTTVAAKGTPLRTFSVTYLNGGLPVAPAQTLTPNISTFAAPPDVPRADTLTITVHYTEQGAEQTVSRSTPLGS